MKPVADNTIVNAYYIHFYYFLSCIPINGRVLKLEGRFVTRELDTFDSHKITRFVPVDDCHRDCIRNNTRVPGELCEESLYDNYEEADQALLDRLHSSEGTLQNTIDQINQNISRRSEEIETAKADQAANKISNQSRTQALLDQERYELTAELACPN
jgi:hypothetical protein